MKHNYLKHLFTALLLLCTTIASAYDFEVGGIYYNITSSIDKTVAVTYKGNSFDDYLDEYNAAVTIPANVTYSGITYRVTGISEYAFARCVYLTNIEIPNSVTSIGNYAFAGCQNQSFLSIEIPNSVTSIGTGAFNSCSGLTGNLEIPNSVTSIGESAFAGCRKLLSIVIPNSVTSIGFYTFQNCSGLTSIEIPNSVTSIGAYAFAGCSGLTSVVIPNSVTSIGDHAFYRCTGLTSITIPNSVTSIGDYAFYNCTALESITSLIPAEDLFAITSYVFENVNKNACTLYVPYGTRETYTSTAGWSEFVNVVEIMPTEVNISINQYGAGTYCSPYALDFSNVEGLKAYSAIGYKPSTQTVTLARVMTTGAGQGIFIKGEPGEYKVPIIDDFDEYTLNLLVGTLEQTTVNSTDGKMSNYKFTITDGDAAPMFYPFEDNTTFSANRAYLQIPTAWLPATAQKSLNVRFDDGETTDIEELKGEPTVDASQSGEVKTVYDLQGRVVENPTNGIYIVNGKKVIIK